MVSFIFNVLFNYTDLALGFLSLYLFCDFGVFFILLVTVGMINLLECREVLALEWVQRKLSKKR